MALPTIQWCEYFLKICELSFFELKKKKLKKKLKNNYLIPLCCGGRKKRIGGCVQHFHFYFSLCWANFPNALLLSLCVIYLFRLIRFSFIFPVRLKKTKKSNSLLNQRVYKLELWRSFRIDFYMHLATHTLLPVYLYLSVSLLLPSNSFWNGPKNLQRNGAK